MTRCPVCDLPLPGPAARCAYCASWQTRRLGRALRQRNAWKALARRLRRYRAELESARMLRPAAAWLREPKNPDVPRMTREEVVALTEAPPPSRRRSALERARRAYERGKRRAEARDPKHEAALADAVALAHWGDRPEHELAAELEALKVRARATETEAPPESVHPFSLSGREGASAEQANQHSSGTSPESPRGAQNMSEVSELARSGDTGAEGRTYGTTPRKQEKQAATERFGESECQEGAIPVVAGGPSEPSPVAPGGLPFVQWFQVGAWGPLDPLWCLVGVLAALCGIVLSKRTALWVRRLDERFLLAVNPTWERRWFLPPEHDTAHALQVPPFSAMLYDTTERTDARWPFGEPAPAAWRERIGQVQLIWPSGIGAAELGDEHELLLRAVVDEARAKRTDLEALDEAHALLADPARWCQGHAARAGDMPTDPCALQADRWCLLGALDKAGALMSVHLELARTLHLFEHGRLPAELDLAAATEALSDWNDADGRQHVQVLALILDTCARLTRELETGEVRS